MIIQTKDPEIKPDDILKAFTYRMKEQNERRLMERRIQVKGGVNDAYHEPKYLRTQFTAVKTFERMEWLKLGFSESEVDLLTCKYKLSAGIPKLYTV